jgi:hypothetical protein
MKNIIIYILIKIKKMNYINKDEQIEHIKIIIDYQVKSFEKLFKGVLNASNLLILKNFIGIILLI